MQELGAALDELIDHFGAGAWGAEVVAARAEYAERTGKVFEDDELYEARTAAFLEWYAVERPLGAESVAPAVVAYRRERRPAFAAWARSHRSLFSIEELLPGRVRLVDLCAGAWFDVDEPRRLIGVSPGDLVEARLVAWKGAPRFGRTFLYHPASAREAILGHVRRLRGQGAGRTAVVDFAARLKVRSLRYRHVAPERVYELGSAEITTR